MPMSLDLQLICKRLKIRKMADLSTVTEQDLRKVSKSTSQIIPEIEELINLARAEYVTPRLSGSAKISALSQESQNKSAVHTHMLRRDGRATAIPSFTADDNILIPISERGRSIGSIALSVRLRHVLESRNIRILGDLNGLNYRQISKFRNCGRKTAKELQELVRGLQTGGITTKPGSAALEITNVSVFVVPASISDFLLSDLPLSVRLEKVLRRQGCDKLGDVNGFEIKDLLKVQNCGKRSIRELQDIIRRASTGEFTPPECKDLCSAVKQLAISIDAALTDLPQRNRTIFEARIGNRKVGARTLENIAKEFKMTRERVRQIVRDCFEKIRRSGGLKLKNSVQSLARECEQHVCPLTPDLFSKWLAGATDTLAHDPLFYVRVLDAMGQDLPAWPLGSREERGDYGLSAKLAIALESWMRGAGVKPTLSEAYGYLRQQSKFKNLEVAKFLAGMRGSRKLLIDFPEPERPHLRLRRLRIFDFARPVLEESNEPLTPEEIIARAKVRYGQEAIFATARSASNVLSTKTGIYLLEPRAVGLRKHFKTPDQFWPAIKNRFAHVLTSQNRPVSTTEAVGLSEMAEFRIKNAYEMAAILREDERFVDLGRHLFALTEWGKQDREFVKDLLPRVFREANRVLTLEQTLEKLTRFRSVSPNSVASQLKKHPEISSFGFGYYGLNTWGEKERNVIFSDRRTVERAVRRAPKPVNFQTLCQIFSIAVTGEQADLLWKSCAGSAKLRRAPDQQGPETLFLHKSVSLEQSLAEILRGLQRPVPAYELEWELKARYGELFASIDLREIEQRLTQSEWFVRDSAGLFVLDEDFDNEEFDPDAIRTAVTKSLSESMDIAGCDELLERLELLGFELDDLSEDMLASILRGTAGLQEVADQRFRARQ